MKIALVNDRETRLDRLRQLILSVPTYQLLWVARDGGQAVTKCCLDPPDVLLMAIDLPILDGVEATRQIMSRSPCAILALTDDLSRNSPQIFEAMGYGLLDVVSLPPYPDDPEWGQILLDKIAMIGRLIGTKVDRKSIPLDRAHPCHPLPNLLPPLIVIGSSTGGPGALATILSALPDRLKASIVIVQHLNPEFLAGLVTWLDRQTSLKVQIASAGDYLETGKVFVANTRNHLKLSADSRLIYSKKLQDRAYCPSIDGFFDSVASHEFARGIGVLLTGMGSDGARGLARLRRKGWHTIAQSRSTCVVYGMPKAAITLGAAEEILDLDAIAPTLLLKLSTLG